MISSNVSGGDLKQRSKTMPPNSGPGSFLNITYRVGSSLLIWLSRQSVLRNDLTSPDFFVQACHIQQNGRKPCPVIWARPLLEIRSLFPRIFLIGILDLLLIPCLYFAAIMTILSLRCNKKQLNIYYYNCKPEPLTVTYIYSAWILDHQQISDIRSDGKFLILYCF
jgi:hypothetical protein